MLQEFFPAQPLGTFEELPGVVLRSARAAGFDEARVYLVDVQQYWLVPMTLVGEGDERLQALRVDATLAGRAYRDSEDIETSDETRRRLWLPLVHNAERLGVLHLSTEHDGVDLEPARWLASLVALQVLSKRCLCDTYNRLVRTREMNLSAEVQWALLPPSTFASESVVISGALEPAYTVGGDAFDYAVTGPKVSLATFDAMGHDLSSSLAATIAVQSWRNTRRAGDEVDLVEATNAIDAALVEQFQLDRYVTGALAQLDTTAGWLSWVLRGHPAPLLIRGGRWVKTLECPSAPPMGLGWAKEVKVCREQLEPGDRVVFYTDGVVDARSPQGDVFGEQRFAEFITRREAAGLSAPETLRQLLHAIVAHHQDRLRDDATIMLVEWSGPHR